MLKENACDNCDTKAFHKYHYIEIQRVFFSGLDCRVINDIFVRKRASYMYIFTDNEASSEQLNDST